MVEWMRAERGQASASLNRYQAMPSTRAGVRSQRPLANRRCRSRPTVSNGLATPPIAPASLVAHKSPVKPSHCLRHRRASPGRAPWWAARGAVAASQASAPSAL